MNYPPPENGAFQDPLENYDPKSYADPLEAAISEDKTSKLQHQPYSTIAADATVADAVKALASAHIACLLVEKDDKLVGLFTNREVLNKVALEPDVLNQPVSSVMTSEPAYVHEDDPIAATLCVMAVHGYRHVPILDYDEKIVGIVSPQRVTNYLQENYGKN